MRGMADQLSGFYAKVGPVYHNLPALDPDGVYSGSAFGKIGKSGLIGHGVGIEQNKIRIHTGADQTFSV